MGDGHAGGIPGIMQRHLACACPHGDDADSVPGIRILKWFADAGKSDSLGYHSPGVIPRIVAPGGVGIGGGHAGSLHSWTGDGVGRVGGKSGVVGLHYQLPKGRVIGWIVIPQAVWLVSLLLVALEIAGVLPDFEIHPWLRGLSVLAVNLWLLIYLTKKLKDTKDGQGTTKESSISG